MYMKRLFSLTKVILILLFINLSTLNLNAKGYSADYPEVGNLNKYKVGDIVKIGNIKFIVKEDTFTDDDDHIYTNPRYKYNPKTLGEKYRYLEILHPERHIKDVLLGKWDNKYLEGSRGSMIMIYNPNSYDVVYYRKRGVDDLKKEFNYTFYAMEKVKERYGKFFSLYTINIKNCDKALHEYLANLLGDEIDKKHKYLEAPLLIIIKNSRGYRIRAPPAFDEGIKSINDAFSYIENRK